MSANLGSFHCGICQRENLSVKNFVRLCLGLDIISPFGRPSEFISKNKNRWARMECEEKYGNYKKYKRS